MLRARTSELRCPYCHAGLETLALATSLCSRCRALSHEDCIRELGACATCRRPARVASLERPLTWRECWGSWSRDSELGPLVALGLLFTLTTSGLIALGVGCAPSRSGPSCTFSIAAVDFGGEDAPMSRIAANGASDARPASPARIRADQARHAAVAALQRGHDFLQAGDPEAAHRELERAVALERTLDEATQELVFFSREAGR